MISEKKLSTSPSWGYLIRNLAIFLALVGGFAYAAFPIAALFGWLAHPETRLATFLIGSIVGEWVGFAVLVYILHRKGIRLGDLGWGQPTTIRAFVLAILVAIAYCAVTVTNPQVGAHLLQWSALKGLALLAALTAGIVEETVFRGYLMHSLAQMKYQGFVQVIVGGLAFSLAHIYGFSSPASYLLTLIFTLLLGIALGTVYLIGKRSLTPVILSHFLIDAVIEPWLLLSFFMGPIK